MLNSFSSVPPHLHCHTMYADFSICSLSGIITKYTSSLFLALRMFVLVLNSFWSVFPHLHWHNRILCCLVDKALHVLHLDLLVSNPTENKMFQKHNWLGIVCENTISASKHNLPSSTSSLQSTKKIIYSFSVHSYDSYNDFL